MGKCSKQQAAMGVSQANVRYAACLRGRRRKDLPPPYHPFVSGKTLIIVAGGVVIIGGIILLPEVTIPALVIAP